MTATEVETWTGPVLPDDWTGFGLNDDPRLTYIQERGLCAQTDPEAFFPEKGERNDAAKKICMACDVREECLAWALDNNVEFGVWGAMGSWERRLLKEGNAA